MRLYLFWNGLLKFYLIDDVSLIIEFRCLKCLDSIMNFWYVIFLNFILYKWNNSCVNLLMGVLFIGSFI